jgi:GDPmannose 4,6-dehydratase
MQKKALITGIAGQDGSYLAELLISKGYEVHGLSKAVNIEDLNYFWRLQSVIDKITIHYGSIESIPMLYRIISKIRPDECYHLAAQSFVSFNFEEEFATMNTNIGGTHNILSVLYQVVPNCKFYFSGTSEMFGDVSSYPQSEDVKFYPRSIYGISKVAGYELTRNYRVKYGMYACSGILYNHESIRRGAQFVTKKITTNAVKIKLGLQDKLFLGDVSAERDWGFAGDYVEAMYRMLQANEPDDFVIGTGILHSVKNIAEIAFDEIGLDWEKYVEHDTKYDRVTTNVLLANPQKAEVKLKWKAETKFEALIRGMVRNDLALLKN